MRLSVAGFVLSIFAALSAAGAVVPAGTTVEIRLKTKMASNASKVKDPVEALIIRPVMVNGELLIAAGGTLSGEITDVKKAGESGQAELGFNLTKLTPAAGGKSSKVSMVLKKVDNARETVNDKGIIVGIIGSDTISSRMDQGIARVAERYKGLADLLGTTKGAFVKQSDAEIVYVPGVEMSMELKSELPVATPPPAPVIPAIRNEDALVQMVQAQPYRTYAEKPPKPSDITSLMFLATEQRLDAAFHAAGWSTAAELTHDTAMETFRAIAESRGYKEAPMSILLLDGQKQMMVFQKQNNTFAMRHHLRIWKRPETFDGQTVWVCSATHDIGIEFSPQNRTFIHKIDTNIDAERAKIVSDLLLTGMVKGLSLVDRPEVPKHSQNATGDNLDTDGAMAVMLIE